MPAQIWGIVRVGESSGSGVGLNGAVEAVRMVAGIVGSGGGG